MNKNKAKAPNVPDGLVCRAKIDYKPSTINEEERSVDFVLSTEAPAMVFDWDRWEIVEEVIRADGVQLPSSNKIPLLDSHDRSGTEKILGSVRNIRREGRSVVGTLYFANKKEAIDNFEMIRDGHLDSGSVGYQQLDSVFIEKGAELDYNGDTYTGELLLTKSWALKEFSLVAIGADENAKVRTQAQKEIDGQEAVEKISEVPNMDEKITNQEQPQIDTEAIRAEAIKAEQERSAKITELCQKHSLANLCGELIRTGASIEKAQSAILEQLEKRSEPTTRAEKPSIEMKADETDKFREAATDGLLLRAGVRLQKPTAGADEFRKMTFKSLARECLRKQGINANRMSDTEALEMAVRSGTMGTSDFSNILDQSTLKAVSVGFDMARQTWRNWARAGNISNLEAARRVNLDDAPDMLLTPEGAEIVHGIIGDRGESIQLGTYARKLRITRRAMLADDLGLFQNIFVKFGARAGNLIDEIAYGIIEDNGDMADGEAIFKTTSDRGANLVTGSAVVSSSTLDAAYQAIMNQEGSNGSKLGIVPRYLLVGPKNRVAASILTTSMHGYTGSDYVAGTAGSMASPFSDIVPIVTPHISNAFYLVADPNMADTVEVAFLDGRESPTVYSVDNDGDILGRTFVGYFDVGAAATDYRGMHKHNGA